VRARHVIDLAISLPFVVVVKQEFFGVVVGVGAGLVVVEVGWWDPLRVAVLVSAGGPAVFDGWAASLAVEVLPH
jgi:hypothetical protein